MGGINSGRHHSPATIERRSIERQREVAYTRMFYDAKLPWCWACGKSDAYFYKPLGWHGPWLVERAHIIAGNRVKDVRAAVLLCSLCHKIQHGERIVCDGFRINIPRLLREHMLWLKYHRDRENYDFKFIQSFSIKRLPRMRKPPIFYMGCYEHLRGNVTA